MFQLKQERSLIKICIICLIVFLYFNPYNEDFLSYIIVSQDSEQFDINTTFDQPIAASLLPKKGKLFCWVQTTPKYHSTRVNAINSTWLSRCDHGQFFTSSSMSDPTIPYSNIFSKMPDSWYKLVAKSHFAFYHIYQSISKDFEWYLKADDDSYVIVEHLREYLSKFDSNKPYLIGHVYKPYLKKGYVSGGATYAISREALRIFAEELYTNQTLCPLSDKYEDVAMSRCFANKNIFPMDTRNEKGQQRFHPESMKTVLEKNEENPKFAMHKVFSGVEAFAAETITFHHLTPTEILMIDSLLYRIRSPQLSKYQKAN